MSNRAHCVVKPKFEIRPCAGCWCNRLRSGIRVRFNEDVDILCLSNKHLFCGPWRLRLVDRGQYFCKGYGYLNICCFKDADGSASILRSAALERGDHFLDVSVCARTCSRVIVGVAVCNIADSNRLDAHDIEIFSEVPSNGTVPYNWVGEDDTTWGVSNQGFLHHGGAQERVSEPFNSHFCIGVRLDRINHTATFVNDTQVLCTVNVPLKPMCYVMSVDSLRCTVQVSQAFSAPRVDFSLQYMCCLALRQLRPMAADIFDGLSVPAAVAEYLRATYGWVTSMPEQ